MWSVLPLFVFALVCGEKVPVERIYLSNVVSFAASNSAVLLSEFAGGDSVISWYDLKSGTLKQVKDGRLGHGLFRFLPLKDGGFALYALFQQKIHVLDAQGTFRETHRVQEYEGFSPDLEIMDISPYGEGLALVTYEERGSNRLHLALLDTELKSIDIIHAQAPEYEGQWAAWCAGGKRIFFTDRANGQVRVFDPDTKQYGPSLLPEREKVVNTSVAGMALRDRSLQKMHHKFLLTYPISTPAGLKLQVIDVSLPCAPVGISRGRR